MRIGFGNGLGRARASNRSLLGTYLIGPTYSGVKVLVYYGEIPSIRFFTLSLQDAGMLEARGSCPQSLKCRNRVGSLVPL